MTPGWPEGDDDYNKLLSNELVMRITY